MLIEALLITVFSITGFVSGFLIAKNQNDSKKIDALASQAKADVLVAVKDIEAVGNKVVDTVERQ